MSEEMGTDYEKAAARAVHDAISGFYDKLTAAQIAGALELVKISFLMAVLTESKGKNEQH